MLRVTFVDRRAGRDGTKKRGEKKSFGELFEQFLGSARRRFVERICPRGALDLLSGRVRQRARPHAMGDYSDAAATLLATSLVACLLLPIPATVVSSYYHYAGFERATCAGGDALQDARTFSYAWTTRCKFRASTHVLLANGTVDEASRVRLRFPVLPFLLAGDNAKADACHAFEASLGSARTFACYVERDAPAGAVVEGYRALPPIAGYVVFLVVSSLSALFWLLACVGYGAGRLLGDG